MRTASVALTATVLLTVGGAAPATATATSPPTGCTRAVCLYDRPDYDGLIHHSVHTTLHNVGAAGDRAESVYNNSDRTIRFYEHLRGGSWGEHVCVRPRSGLTNLNNIRGMGNRISQYQAGGACGG